MDLFTILMFVVFVLQALYIVRLQYLLNSFKARTIYLQDVVVDIIDGNVVANKTHNGFQIIRNRGE